MAKNVVPSDGNSKNKTFSSAADAADTTELKIDAKEDEKLGPLELESAVGLCYDKYCLKHMEGVRHCEIPLRIKSIYDYFTKESAHKNKWIKVDARLATKEECLWVHSSNHMDKIWDMPKKFTGEDDTNSIYFAQDCIITHGTYRSILLSCGGLLEGTEKVLRGVLNSCCCVLRPPGHHAECSKFMGFCYVNNVGVAAELAKRKFGIERIAIVDWDVHWGNATQRMFYNDPTVFYISTHRFDDGDFYPCDEHASEKHIGEGKGKGFNMNLPLYREMGDKQYMAIFDHLIIPILRMYKPQLIIISAGFDSAWGDPLGGMTVTTPGYAYFTEQLKAIQSRIVVCLEGGYNCDYIPKCYHATAQALLKNERLYTKREEYLKDSPSMRRSFEEDDKKAIARMITLRRLMWEHWPGFSTSMSDGKMSDEEWEESLRLYWGQKKL